MATYVAGLFEERGTAERAICALHKANFDASLIGMVTPHGRAQEERIVGMVAPDGHAPEERIASEEAVDGAAAGVVLGGVAGGLLASAGALVIPGIGPFLSAGI